MKKILRIPEKVLILSISAILVILEQDLHMCNKPCMYIDNTYSSPIVKVNYVFTVPIPLLSMEFLV